MSDSLTCYRGPKSGDLIVHVLDSMTLVFQRSSGITHVVGDPIPAIVKAIEGQCLTASGVAERLAASFDMEADGDVTEIVSARLDELAQIGIIEQVRDVR